MATTSSVTPESIASEKAYQQIERAHVEAVTGLRITDAELAYVIICPRCLEPIGGENEGLATRALGRHLVNQHARQGGN